MSNEFASAMVTVIPLVMLMCAAEAKVVYAYWDSKADDVVASVDFPPQNPMGIYNWAYRNFRKLLPWVTSLSGALYWLLMAAAHLLAEAGLILWLASARPPGVEYLDELVVWTAIWGFAHATVLGTLIVFLRIPLRLMRAMDAEVQRTVRRLARQQRTPTL
ncbi:hypothetical protein [Streptomyces sp. NPDC020489]|uniref:hypothetical protein n=1 Tax=Streptomyces sp. NPDC020489 TaxID=3365077 RepID=UPI003799CA8F